MADYCKHDIDISISVCVSCADTRPRGGVADPRARQVVHGPEHDAMNWNPSWRGALDSIPRTDNDWRELHATLIDSEPSLGPWIDARYYGTCSGCGFRWEPGDMIRKDDDQDAWICSECGSK